MKAEDVADWGSKSLTLETWKFLNVQIDLLQEVREKIVVGKEKVGLNVVVGYLITLAVDLGRSMDVVMQRGLIGGAFANGRAFLETLVNICFICAQGEDGASRAERHALQKSFRDLDRVIQGRAAKWHVKWTEKDNLVIDEKLREALAEYSRNGREIRDWTPESILDRIDAIADKFGKNYAYYFQLFFLYMYRHGSEVIHGTFFGALHCMGMTSPNAPRNELELRTKHLITISTTYSHSAFITSEAIKILSATFPDCGLDDVEKRSQKVVDDFFRDNRSAFKVEDRSRLGYQITPS